MAERDSNGRARPEVPIGGRLLEGGARGVGRIAGATGIDRAVEVVVEETIVRAVESAAVERAIARLIEDGRLADAVEASIDEDRIEETVKRAIDSEVADRIWEDILASDKAQMLVERIAEAPEVRVAIAAQGFGLIADIGRQVCGRPRPRTTSSSGSSTGSSAGRRGRSRPTTSGSSGGGWPSRSTRGSSPPASPCSRRCSRGSCSDHRREDPGLACGDPLARRIRHRRRLLRRFLGLRGTDPGDALPRHPARARRRPRDRRQTGISPPLEHGPRDPSLRPRARPDPVPRQPPRLAGPHLRDRHGERQNASAPWSQNLVIHEPG